MADPELHLIAGPNGAGKTTFYVEILGPATGLEFINADEIAKHLWPGDELRHAYDASRAAAVLRGHRMEERTSFIAETVFSHPSKIQLLRDASDAGYRSTLHIVAIPVELAVMRVRIRSRLGGHDVPENKIRERWTRLWGHLVEAIGIADQATLYDNSGEDAYLKVAEWVNGHLAGGSEFPIWLPEVIRNTDI